MSPVGERKGMVDLDVRGGLVDVVVNGVPLAILLLFVVVFVVIAPWGVGGLATVLQLGILLGTAAALVTITYQGNRLIVQAQGDRADPASDEKSEVGRRDHSDDLDGEGTSGERRGVDSSGDADGDDAAHGDGAATDVRRDDASPGAEREDP